MTNKLHLLTFNGSDLNTAGNPIRSGVQALSTVRSIPKNGFRFNSVFRATPTEYWPFLGNPVSSMIHQPPAVKSIYGTTYCATRRSSV